jgi:hypothetical protein
MTDIFASDAPSLQVHEKLMLGTEQSAQGCGGATQLFIASQTIGTEAEPLSPCIANNAFTLQPGGKLHRLCQVNGKKSSMVLVAAPDRIYAGVGETSTQGVELLQAVRAKSLNPHTQGEFQTTAGLVPGEHGWSGLEETIATVFEHWRIRPVISKGIGIGKPAHVEGPQAGLEYSWRNV